MEILYGILGAFDEQDSYQSEEDDGEGFAKRARRFGYQWRREV